MKTQQYAGISSNCAVRVRSSDNQDITVIIRYLEKGIDSEETCPYYVSFGMGRFCAQDGPNFQPFMIPSGNIMQIAVTSPSTPQFGIYWIQFTRK